MHYLSRKESFRHSESNKVLFVLKKIMTAVEAGVGWSFLERKPERNKRAEKDVKRITRGKGKGRIWVESCGQHLGKLSSACLHTRLHLLLHSQAPCFNSQHFSSSRVGR